MIVVLGGTGSSANGIVTNTDSVKGWYCITNVVTVTTPQGALTLDSASSKPSPPGTPCPLSTAPTIEVACEGQLSLLTNQGGGLQPTPFNFNFSTSTTSADFGVDFDVENNGPHWHWYNASDWNIDTDPESTFGNWWASRYGDSDVVNALNSNEAKTTVPFDGMASWTIPANPGNASPLNVQFDYGVNFGFAGFANCDGSGNGHHMITWCNSLRDFPLATWDLVAITRGPTA